MTVTSGLKCCELYRKSGQLGSLVRMLLGSSAWNSTRCYLTWKVSGTPHKRLLFRLVPSTHRTEGTGLPLWPNPTARDSKGANSMEHLATGNHVTQLANAVRLWPTPTSSDRGRTAINPILTQNGTIRRRNKIGRQSYARLDQVAAMFPTPTARCHAKESNSETRQGTADLQTKVGGQLNPMWVEWLMGFPIGWTDLNASETQSCHNSSIQSSGR